MKKVIRLTESDLHRIVENSVKKILRENDDMNQDDINRAKEAQKRIQTAKLQVLMKRRQNEFFDSIHDIKYTDLYSIDIEDDGVYTSSYDIDCKNGNSYHIYLEVHYDGNKYSVVDASVVPRDDNGNIQEDFEFNINRGEVLDILEAMSEEDFYDWIESEGYEEY